MTQRKTSPVRTPVILDTDIGTDIDDTWALAMMLNSPELDVKLIVTDQGDTPCRARVVCRMLEAAGRADIPIGVGIQQNNDACPQAAWVEGYGLERYPGEVRQDGVQALIDTIMESAQPVTLICIGPVPNIYEALRREPAIAQRSRFVGMHGCIRSDTGRTPIPGFVAEYNVVTDIAACRAAFTAPWPITITPLDTCGLVKLRGDKYRAVRDCSRPLIRALLDNYRVWLEAHRLDESLVETESSRLFDTVAIHLAYSREFLNIRQMNVKVDDKGFTVEDPSAHSMDVALEWTDLPGYEDELVARLVGTRR